MSIWDTPGRDKYYEHCRNSSHSDLRKWVDEAYVKVAPYLDNGWVDNLRNGDFYSRLWELELAEWFILTGTDERNWFRFLYRVGGWLKSLD